MNDRCYLILLVSIILSADCLPSVASPVIWALNPGNRLVVGQVFGINKTVSVRFLIILLSV